MPARNEEELVGYALASLANQSVKPSLALLIDDSSTDKTPQILRSFALRYRWAKYLRIERPGGRNVGAAVARALIIGVKYATEVLSLKWDFLLKIDADTVYEKNYIAKLLEKFMRNKHLGVASGVTVNEPVNPEHARGPGLMIRRIVWEQVNLKPIIGWDSYIVFKAQMLGWETRSFNDVKMFVLRKTGVSEGSITRGKYKQGYASSILGYPLITAFGRSLRLATIYRSVKIVPYFMAGYFSAKLSKVDLVEKELKSWITRKQYSRVLKALFLRRI